MKTKFLVLLFILVLFSAGPVWSQPAAPPMINVQAVLVDEGGNVLYDKQEEDITFSIIDGAGTPLYTEVQHVVLVNGAISVLVGRGKDPVTGGSTGGIPYDAFDPDGSRLLRIK